MSSSEGGEAGAVPGPGRGRTRRSHTIWAKQNFSELGLPAGSSGPGPSITQQFHHHVEEYITFLENEYQGSRLREMEREAEAEVLKHNLAQARTTLEKILLLARSENNGTLEDPQGGIHPRRGSGSSAAAEYERLITGAAAGSSPSSSPWAGAGAVGAGLASLDGRVKNLSASALDTLELVLPQLPLPDFAKHQEVLSGFARQQEALEGLCAGLRTQLGEHRRREAHVHADADGGEWARKRESRLAGLFKTTAKVESQAFAQHEAVSRNYDTLLERYMALVDETKRLKREIKDALPGSAGAAPLY